MGWISYHATCYKKNGTIDRKAEMDSGFSSGYRVLKSAMYGSTYYAAVEKASGSGEKNVFAYVALTSVDNKHYHNFYYKSMDETCGPCYYDCPNSILDLLTPTDDEWANAWRDKCREKNKKPKLGKLPIGSMESSI